MSELVEFLRARLDEDKNNLLGLMTTAGGRPQLHRWRADVDAKRRIIDLCVAEIDNGTDGAITAASVLYWLVQPYADYPDYCDEWVV